MKLADNNLAQAFGALSPMERRAIVDLLRYTPGADRAKLQASALRRVKAMLKRRARAGR